MAALDPDAMAGFDTHKIVLSLLDPADGLPALDLGTGQGALADAMVARGHRVTAYGFDAAQYVGTAPFKTVDLDEGLPDEDDSVGCLTAVEVIEHLESPLRLLREMHRVLVDGGYALVTTPNVMSLSARIDTLLSGNADYFGDREYSENGHISPVSLTTIERMAERLGFTLEVVTYNVGLVPVPRLRNRMPLRGWWRNQAFGQSLIVKLRKDRSPSAFARG